MKQVFCAVLLAVLACRAQALAPADVDSMAARTAACAACHGVQGRATAQGYFPRIAGKPEGYLYQQLRHFRDGRRINHAMTAMVARLPDAYLKEIAAHFAAQYPPYATPAAPQAGQRAAARRLAGQRLVMHGDPARKLPACVACHGQQLAGVAPAIPGLLGLPRDYLTLQLSHWRKGSRRALAPDCMAHVARALTDEEMIDVAAWLAAQPVPQHAKPAPALSASLPLACAGVQ